MGIEKKICIVCGAVFHPRHSKHICCSDACRVMHKKNMGDQRYKSLALERKKRKVRKVCVVCGASFIAVNQRYLCCSKECSKKHAKERSANKSKKARKVCVVCGASFIAVNQRYICCSKECSKKHTKERCAKHRVYRKICPICGKEFVIKASSQKYCSVLCRKTYNAECILQRYYNKKYLYKKVCEFCGKKFSTANSSKKTCSIGCFYLLRNEKEWEHYQDIDFDVSILIPQTANDVCVICGKHFTSIQCRQKTCSKECRQVYRKIYNSLCGGIKRRLLLDQDIDDSQSAEDGFIDAPIDSVLHGGCPYALGLLRSDSMFLPVR